MRVGRGFVRTVVASLTILVVLFTSGPLGTLPIGVASAAPGHGATRTPFGPAPSGDTGRFTPVISAPKLATSAWHPPVAQPAPQLASTQANGRSVNPSAAGRTPGEQPDLRTATTSTYLNADGTWTLKSFSQPYVYAGNNPLLDVDPSGLLRTIGGGGGGAIIHEVHRVVHHAAYHPHRSLLRTIGGGGGHGGSGSGRGPTQEGVPNDAIWQHSSKQYGYTIYLGKAEKDDMSGYHYNFHVRAYNSGVDRHNFHLTVPTTPWYDPLEWDWTIKDIGKGGSVLGDTLEIQTYAPDPFEAAWQAMFVFFSRVIDDATTDSAGRSELSSLLYVEPWDVGKVKPIYDAFVDLAQHDTYLV